MAMMARCIRMAGFALATVMLAAAPAAADPPDQYLGSRFNVDGTNPNGSKYRGTATVGYESDGDRYRVVWTIGSDTTVGTGRYSQHERVFEAVYDGGIAVYTVTETGVLDGLWRANLNQLDGREVLTPTDKASEKKAR